MRNRSSSRLRFRYSPWPSCSSSLKRRFPSARRVLNLRPIVSVMPPVPLADTLGTEWAGGSSCNVPEKLSNRGINEVQQPNVTLSNGYRGRFQGDPRDLRGMHHLWGVRRQSCNQPLTRWSSGKRWRLEQKVSVSLSNVERDTPSHSRSPATFRELGPPDLCHVVKSTGRTGQRDVCLNPAALMCRFHQRLARHIPLHIGCRRLVFCISSSLYQLPHICDRGQLCLVLTKADLESSEWLLLVPCLSPSYIDLFVC